MKKRILSLMMILPIILMLLVFGFSGTVNLFVRLAPEFIVCDYDDEEVFGYAPAVWESGVELSASVYPANAADGTIEWKIESGYAFDDSYEHTDDDPIAVISGGRLYKIKEGYVEISASVKNTSIKKIFTAYLFDDDGVGANDPKFIIIRGRDTFENGIKSSQLRHFGMYDHDKNAAGGKALHVETFTATVYPLTAPQDVEVAVANAEGVAEFSCGKTDGATKINVTPICESGVNYSFITVKSSVDPSVSAQSCWFKFVDGVNVYSYEDLMFCAGGTAAKGAESEGGEVVVLRTNLESEENLPHRKNSALFGVKTADGVKCEYFPMRSTYDIKEYTNEYKSGVNRGKSRESMGEAPVVYVGVVFRKSVYGNGYTINAHELTYPSEVMENFGVEVATLAPSDLFRGPLDFVKAYNCRCFGQDNIGFLVQGDGVVIDNVTLKNCNNVDNLSNLDYVGTVVEADGDNITIRNSRIMNGRTAVRSMSNKNLLLEACMLSYAREFLLKIGSNKFVYAENIPSMTYNYLSPSADEHGAPLRGNYDGTVTVRNCFFATSGIFSVGMDAHFAGRFLYDFPNDSHVYGMAATSYPSLLSLEGDVRFYDWKSVSGLNSGTLIELGVSDAGTDYSGLFDISSIIENYCEKNNADLLLVSGGEKYVHGGIAFYGGGRNLSEVDYSRLNADKAELFAFAEGDDCTLRAHLNDLGSGLSPYAASILTGAAGYGEFRFCMYSPEKKTITFGSVPDYTELQSYAVIN